MKIVGLVGSIRTHSYNQLLAHYMQKRYREIMSIECIGIQELPFFNQDIEDSPPAIVQSFKKRIADADAVLVITPEYNHSVPGVLKNAIDWLSRGEKVMAGKPVLIAGATTGMLGTVRCQMHLRQIFASPGLSARVLPGNEVLIGKVDEKLNDQGDLIDELTISFLDTVVKKFIDFIKES